MSAEGEGTDPDTYAGVQELRRGLALNNRDLAAMGLDRAKAEQVLTALIQAYEQNRVPLRAARGELATARRMLADGEPLDLVAQALRGATDALDEIAGHTAAEDLLDRVFARFCLGK